MTDDRISGMLWGFNIGTGLMGSIFVHPIMIVLAAVAFAASWWFARRAAVGGASNG